MYQSDALVGKVARVIGSIGANRVGEVMIAVRGGTEAFIAYARDASASYDIGARVVVVAYSPPRTVIVDQH